MITFLRTKRAGMRQNGIDESGQMGYTENNKSRYEEENSYEYDEGEETAITKERFDQVAEIYPGKQSEFWLSKTITPLY